VRVVFPRGLALLFCELCRELRVCGS